MSRPDCDAARVTYRPLHQQQPGLLWETLLGQGQSSALGEERHSCKYLTSYHRCKQRTSMCVGRKLC